MTIKYKKVGIKLATGVIFTASMTVTAAQPKHLMAPPQDIANQQLKKAGDTGVFSHSTMVRIDLPQPASSANTLRKDSVKNANGLAQLNKRIYFDGNNDSPMLLIGPGADAWQLRVTDANGRKIYDDYDGSGTSVANQKINIGSQAFNGKTLLLNTPTVGEWNVALSNKHHQGANKNSAFLVFKGDPNYKLYTYRDNNFTTHNSDVNLVAYLVDSSNVIGNRKSLIARSPLSGSISRAFVEVTQPDGTQTRLKLNDRGVMGDNVAGDGKYSAKLPTGLTGNYTTQVYIEGVRPDGIRYSRTAADIFPVAKISHQIVGRSGKLIAQSGELAEIQIPVRRLAKAKKVFVSGEIFAKDSMGIMQPASWVGGLANAKVDSGGVTNLALQFDSRWLKRKKLQAPIEIRNLRLQNAENHVPLSEHKSFILNVDRVLQSALTKVASDRFKVAANDAQRSDISLDMLAANAPVQFSVKATSNPKLLLVHGYCSGDVWNSSQFSNAAKFQDYNQNRSHESFAQQIMSFGSAYTSYGIVAHSQGGAAGLHLYSRYWSGLDNATGGRLIQSVGTPYQGTALAGNLAVLGQIFGAGCGTNTDLTYSGASNWLSTIPSWARAEVDFYTTSFKTRWWAYDYCHLATDLFLDDPEDGTTEKWSGQLSGAANMGHKKGWCHTNGMRDTAQFKDSNRNSSMNSRAAR